MLHPLEQLRDLLQGPTEPPVALSDAFTHNTAEYAHLCRLAPEWMESLEMAYLQAQRLLSDCDDHMCRCMVKSGVEDAIEMERVRQTSARGPTPAVRLLTRRAAQVQEFLSSRAQGEANRRLASGLVFGVLGSGLLLAVIGLLAAGLIPVYKSLAEGGGSGLDASEYWALRDSLVCIGGGSCGAVLSVLLRLGGSAPLADRTSLRLAAVYRVALGWFFAAALLFLIKGQLIDLFPDPSSELGSGNGDQGALKISSWFFWGGVGFVAGFNERWVQSLITRDPTPAAMPAAVPEEDPDEDEREVTARTGRPRDGATTVTR
jgi:hypothetical protein